MKLNLNLITAILIPALVMLAPSVGWSQMGGSGGMMGSDAGMMGGSIMNNGQMSNQNTVQNGTGMTGTIDKLLNEIGRLLDQGNETERGKLKNSTAMKDKTVRKQDRKSADHEQVADGGQNGWSKAPKERDERR